MNKYYPDFVMRVYLDFDKNHPIDKYLCKLACENPNLDLCDIKQLPGNDILKETKKVFSVRKVFPASWRFFATLDSQVYYLIMIVILINYCGYCSLIVPADNNIYSITLQKKKVLGQLKNREKCFKI